MQGLQASAAKWVVIDALKRQFVGNRHVTIAPEQSVFYPDGHFSFRENLVSHCNSVKQYVVTHSENGKDTSVWLLCICKWDLFPSAICECGETEQIATNVILTCLIQRVTTDLKSVTVIR